MSSLVKPDQLLQLTVQEWVSMKCSVNVPGKREPLSTFVLLVEEAY